MAGMIVLGIEPPQRTSFRLPQSLEEPLCQCEGLCSQIHRLRQLACQGYLVPLSCLTGPVPHGSDSVLKALSTTGQFRSKLRNSWNEIVRSTHKEDLVKCFFCCKPCRSFSAIGYCLQSLSNYCSEDS